MRLSKEEYNAAKQRRRQKVKFMNMKEWMEWMKERKKAGKEYEV